MSGLHIKLQNMGSHFVCLILSTGLLVLKNGRVTSIFIMFQMKIIDERSLPDLKNRFLSLPTISRWLSKYMFIHRQAGYTCFSLCWFACSGWEGGVCGCGCGCGCDGCAAIETPNCRWRQSLCLPIRLLPLCLYRRFASAVLGPGIQPFQILI